jgi:hypothetical protein
VAASLNKLYIKDQVAMKEERGVGGVGLHILRALFHERLDILRAIFHERLDILRALSMSVWIFLGPFSVSVWIS